MGGDIPCAVLDRNDYVQSAAGLRCDSLMGQPCNGQPLPCNECTGYDTTGPLVWVGIDRVIQPGQLDDAECGVGCIPCPDNQMNITPIGIWGGRWLRPHPSKGNRLASGLHGDLQSIGIADGHLQRVRRVPLRTYFQRAACYDQPANQYSDCGECFDDDACLCDNPPSTAYGQCTGTIVAGLHSDSFFYHGIGWPPHSMEEVWCRKVDNHGPETVELVPESEITPLMMGTVLRSEDIDQNYKPLAYQSNALIPCMGISVQQHENCTMTPGTDGTAYVDNDTTYEQRMAWTYIGCNLLDPELRIGDNASAFERATAVAKNKVLDRMRLPFGDDDFKFDRLDNQALGRVQSNHGLYEWSRGWSHEGATSTDPMTYSEEGDVLPSGEIVPVVSFHDPRPAAGIVTVSVTVVADTTNVPSPDIGRVELRMNGQPAGLIFTGNESITCADGEQGTVLRIPAAEFNAQLELSGGDMEFSLFAMHAGCAESMWRVRVFYDAVVDESTPYAALPVVDDVFGECHLLYNPACKVNCELVILRAHITFQLNAQMITDAAPGESMTSDNLKLFPFARARVFVQTGIRAQMEPEDCAALSIVNPDDEDFGEGFGDYSLLPRVKGAGPAEPLKRDQPDRIVYLDPDGNEFDPPRDVYWWGFLGDSSNPRTENHWHIGDSGASLKTNCCWLGKALTPLTVGGWPHGVESKPGEPDTVYTGRIQLRFTGEDLIYGSFCG